MSYSQKESVFNAVRYVVENTANPVVVTKDDRANIIELVVEDLISGRAEFSAEAKAKYTTRDDVKGYVNGMVSNWLRKDTRLNGGVKYETKNPGSRAGSSDEVLKNLKALKTTLTDPEHQKAVDNEIAKRTAELAATKKTVTIDTNKIPEALRYLIPGFEPATTDEDEVAS